MDLRLTAMIALAHVRLRQEVLFHYPHLIDERIAMPTPNLQGLGQMLAKLEHSLETAAMPLVQKIMDVEKGGLDAIKGAHTKVDGIRNRVKEIEGYVAAVAGNGGDPLDGSSNSSGPDSTETTEPEHLTVNGVSQTQ